MPDEPTMGIQTANMDQPVNPGGFGRAAFPGAMQQAASGPLIAPSGDVQTFNEPQPGPGGMKASDLKAAMDTVQAAMRFQGARGLAADLQSGMTPEQALLKNGEKLYAGHEGGFAGAALKIAAMGAKGQMGVGPLQLQKVIGPGGEEVEGVGAATAAGGGIHLVDTARAAREKSKLESAAKKAQDAANKRLLDAAIKERDATPALSPRFAAAQAKVDALQAKLAGSETGAVKLKHKKTGQLFNYKGNAADVPTDEYELVK